MGVGREGEREGGSTMHRKEVVNVALKSEMPNKERQRHLSAFNRSVWSVCTVACSRCRQCLGRPVSLWDMAAMLQKEECRCG